MKNIDYEVYSTIINHYLSKFKKTEVVVRNNLDYDKDRFKLDGMLHLIKYCPSWIDYYHKHIDAIGILTFSKIKFYNRGKHLFANLSLRFDTGLLLGYGQNMLFQLQNDKWTCISHKIEWIKDK